MTNKTSNKTAASDRPLFQVVGTLQYDIDTDELTGLPNRPGVRRPTIGGTRLG